MGSGLLIPIAILAGLLAIAAIRRSRTEHGRRRQSMVDAFWSPPLEEIERSHPLLRELTVMRCGYDRRIEQVGRRISGGAEQLLVDYAFASGFGENRVSFTCTILTAEYNDAKDGHLIATADPRLAAVAMRPGWHHVHRDGRWWISSDERLLGVIDSSVGDCLAELPSIATLERHPGVVAAYQPDAPPARAADQLADAIGRLLQSPGATVTHG